MTETAKSIDKLPSYLNNAIPSVNKRTSQLKSEHLGLADVFPWFRPLEPYLRFPWDNQGATSLRGSFDNVQESFSRLTIIGMNYTGNISNQTQKILFKSFYDNPWTRYWLLPQGSGSRACKEDTAPNEESTATEVADTASFANAVIRIIIAVAGADRILESQQLEAARKQICKNPDCQHMTTSTLQQIVRTQAYTLSSGTNRALNELALMLSSYKARAEAYDIALKITSPGSQGDVGRHKVLTIIRNILGLHQHDEEAKEKSTTLFLHDDLIKNIVRL